MAEMHVEIVAVERELWSGDATFVFTRTTAGEIGILPRHIPLVAQLVDDAMVRVEREGEDDLRIAVDGGFLSVTDEAVRILVENAEFESEINADAGQAGLRVRRRAAPRRGAGRGCAPSASSTESPMSASMMIMVALRRRAAAGRRRADATGCGSCGRSAAPPPSCATSPPSAATAGATA